MSERYSALANRERMQQVHDLVKQSIGKEVADILKASLAKKVEAITKGKMSALNKRILVQLMERPETPRKEGKHKTVVITNERLCKGDGALMSYVTDALESKLAAETKGDKWKQTLKGERALSTYRRTIPIPLRGGWHAEASRRKFAPLRRELFEGKEEVIFEPRLCE